MLHVKYLFDMQLREMELCFGPVKPFSYSKHNLSQSILCSDWLAGNMSGYELTVNATFSSWLLYSLFVLHCVLISYFPDYSIFMLSYKAVFISFFPEVLVTLGSPSFHVACKFCHPNHLIFGFQLQWIFWATFSGIELLGRGSLPTLRRVCFTLL